MKNTKFLIAGLAVFAAGLISFLALRSWKSPMPPVRGIRTEQAVTTTPPLPATPAPAPASVPPAGPVASDRTVDLGGSAPVIAAPYADERSAQLDGIRELEARARDLEQALTRNYGELMAEAVRASLAPSRGIDFELEAADLQQQLTDAKISVANQLHLYNEFTGSDDTDIVRGYRNELIRRQKVVAELEQRIGNLFNEERAAIDDGDSAQTTRLRAWREERNALEAQYVGAVEALEVARRNQAALEARARDAALLPSRK